MREFLIIRFGAMGDLCVLTWALSHLKAQAREQPVRVTLVTKAQFAPLMSQVHGVDEVISLPDSSWRSVRQLAHFIGQRHWDVVIDAHNTLRSHVLLGLLRRRPQARLAKDTAARLAFMKWGRPNPKLSRTMRERFFDLFKSMTEAESGVNLPPLGGLRESGAANACLGVAPGAQWDSKRWPEKYYAQLVRDLRAATHSEIKVFLGPREQAWFPTSELAKVVTADEGVSLVQVPDLVSVAKHLASCQMVITNDSGILHLAEAVGTPVLAFFGPTVREFGYFPLLVSSRVLEHEISCRPCSRNGKRACHRGDLACLTEISPATALAESLAMLDEGPSR